VNLDVIVVTHQSAEALTACFAGLPERDRRCFLVVDNASTDGSAEVARAHGARVLRQAQNLGFGRAANLGAEHATASHLCFLNPDCLPTPELFAAARERFREQPDVCLAPDLIEADERVEPGVQPGYSAAKLLHDMLVTNYREGRLAAWLKRRPGFDDRRWHWPHGACFFLARRRFLSLGGFDVRYFLYMEDVDFGRRLCLAGGTIVRLNHALVHRARGGARVSVAYRLWHLDTARVRYALRQHGVAVALAATALAVPGFLAHVVKSLLKSRRPGPRIVADESCS
jgi:hypothetical protein